MHLETIYVHISPLDYSFLHEESPTHMSTPTANIDIHKYMWNFVKCMLLLSGFELGIWDSQSGTDGCSGSEAQVMSIMSGMDAVKQCININSKQSQAQ